MKTFYASLLLTSGIATSILSAGLNAGAADLDPVNPPKSVTLPAKNRTNGNATPTNGERSARFSAGLDEVVKLSKAGVDESVILAFIESSSVAYRPSADEILKLREVGITSPVVAALLRRGEELRQRSAEAQREAARNATPVQPATAPAAAPASNPPPAQPAAPTSTVINYVPVTPAVTPAVVYSSYPVYYNYSYPSYSYGSYSSCYYPRSYYSSYSCYPRYSYYPRYNSCYYPRATFSVGYRGGYYRGGYGGYRYCR